MKSQPRQSKYSAMVKISNYTRMKFGQVYVLGITGGNSSANATWDSFKVYACVGKEILKRRRINCCFKYSFHSAIKYFKQPTIAKHIPLPKADLTASYYTCNNPNIQTHNIPDGIGLTMGNYTCEEKFVTYVHPLLPLGEPGVTLALSSKAAYGNISAEMIIEWMEAYRYLGVDKIITYFLNTINKDALDVLKYYSSTGLLDLYAHEPAASDDYPRVFDNNDHQFWNDKQMIVYDSFERLSGYTYFGQIDHDEFLIPSRNRSLKQMLADLFKRYTKAAGFVFKTQYFYLSWGRTESSNDLILGSYIKRPSLSPHIDNEKTIFKTKDVLPGTIHTHWTKPVKGLERVVVPVDQGFIRHYRHCRKSEYVEIEDMCLHKLKRVKDTSMADWSERIRKNVEHVRDQVFGTKSRTES